MWALCLGEAWGLALTGRLRVRGDLLAAGGGLPRYPLHVPWGVVPSHSITSLHINGHKIFT